MLEEWGPLWPRSFSSRFFLIRRIEVHVDVRQIGVQLAQSGDKLLSLPLKSSSARLQLLQWSIIFRSGTGNSHFSLELDDLLTDRLRSNQTTLLRERQLIVCQRRQLVRSRIRDRK